LNVETTHLPDLNVENTQLANYSIVDLDESDEDNLKEKTKESNNEVIQYLSLYVCLLYRLS
jgi:uncharacterized protein YgfB (UPF0149 family)